MTPALVESRHRLPGRLLAVIALVFTLQTALIFWLGDHNPSPPHRPAPVLDIGFGDARPEELAALEDPTLFVLPHEPGFSGEAWMRVPKQEFHSEDWSEPPRWLSLPARQLGMAFSRFAETNASPRFQNLLMLQPALTYPQIPPSATVSAPSSLRIEGDLTRRRLLAKPDLRPWQSSDLLTNSVVQLLVDARGRTFSAALLPPGSGSSDADQFALQFAKMARFNSIEPQGPGTPAVSAPQWTIGTMIFNWQTLPPTNGGSAVHSP